MSSVLVRRIFKYEYSKGWGVHEHNHNYYQVYFVANGSANMVLDSKEIHIETGDIILLRPHVKHLLEKIKEDSLFVFDVEFDVDLPLLQQRLDNLPTVNRFTPSMLKLVGDVRKEWRTGTEYGKMLSNCMLEQVLWKIIKQDNSENSSAKKGNFVMPELKCEGITKAVQEYIESNYNKEFSLDDLAIELWYSKNYLCKLFKLETGYTIKSYVNRYRIQKALEHISNTREKLSVISENVGFKDIHHFTKVFKRVTGFTPGNIKNTEVGELYDDIIAHGVFSWRYYEDDDGES